MLFTAKRPTSQATTEVTSPKQAKSTATAVVYRQLDNHGANNYSVSLSDDDEKIALLALTNAAENLTGPELIVLYELTKDLQRIGFDTETGPKYQSSNFPWAELPPKNVSLTIYL